MAKLSRQERRMPDPEDDFRRIEDSYLKSLGPSLAVQRLRRRWGKVRTRMHVFGGLKEYAEWLRATGKMPQGGLDGLVEENQLNQRAQDVNTRVKHLEWADTYLNEVLVGKVGDARRKQIRYAISSFYTANFSPLQGELRVALHDAPKKKKGILPEEVRRVLLALPFPHRLPLLLQWQSGLNIFMMLCLR